MITERHWCGISWHLTALGKTTPAFSALLTTWPAISPSKGTMAKPWCGTSWLLRQRESALKGSPGALNTINNMDNALQRYGDYSKALVWYRRAFDCCEKALGNGHPVALSAVGNNGTNTWPWCCTSGHLTGRRRFSAMPIPTLSPPTCQFVLRCKGIMERPCVGTSEHLWSNRT